MCRRYTYFGTKDRDVYQLWVKRNKEAAKAFCLKLLEKLKMVKNESVIDACDMITLDIEQKFLSTPNSAN